MCLSALCRLKALSLPFHNLHNISSQGMAAVAPPSLGQEAGGSRRRTMLQDSVCGDITVTHPNSADASIVSFDPAMVTCPGQRRITQDTVTLAGIMGAAESAAFSAADMQVSPCLCHI